MKKSCYPYQATDYDLPKLLVAGKGQGTVDPGMVKLGWVDAATVPRAVMKGDTQVLEYDLIRP